MTNCCVCDKRLGEGEGGYVCDGCLRPREEWEREIKGLESEGDFLERQQACLEMKFTQLTTAAQQAIDSLRYGSVYKWQIADSLAAALASVKVTP